MHSALVFELSPGSFTICGVVELSTVNVYAHIFSSGAVDEH